MKIAAVHIRWDCSSQPKYSYAIMRVIEEDPDGYKKVKIDGRIDREKCLHREIELVFPLDDEGRRFVKSVLDRLSQTLTYEWAYGFSLHEPRDMLKKLKRIMGEVFANANIPQREILRVYSNEVGNGLKWIEFKDVVDMLREINRRKP